MLRSIMLCDLDEVDIFGSHCFATLTHIEFDFLYYFFEIGQPFYPSCSLHLQLSQRQWKMIHCGQHMGEN
jgi:hypothetical protein